MGYGITPSPIGHNKQENILNYEYQNFQKEVKFKIFNSKVHLL